MTTETRFKNLVDSVPEGQFYDELGNIIPFGETKPTSFRIETNFPNERFLIRVNDVVAGFVTTDVNGDAIFNILLPLGDLELRLEREFSTDFIRTVLTTRHSAVWHAALAEQIETIDDSIENTLKSFYLAQALQVDIDLAHGVPLLTPNEFNLELEAYREALQLIRQSFRQFAGRTAGKFGIVSALTQINPLIFDRAKLAPRWILGFDRLPNSDLQESTRVPTGALTNINTLGTFLSLTSVDDYVNTGTGEVLFSKNFQRLRWNPPHADILGLEKATLFNSNDVSADGSITLRSGRFVPFIESLHFPITITAADNDHLHFQLDDRPIIDANLSFGTAINLSTRISAWAQAKYYQASIPLTQPILQLKEFVEVVSVNDNSPDGTATINHLGSNRFTYTAPGDVAGTEFIIANGQTGILYSDNGVDFITLFNSSVTPPAGAFDTFTIGRRYDSTTSQLIASGDQLIIESKHKQVSDGKSFVAIHPGPADLSSFPDPATPETGGTPRGLFDIPQISAGLKLAASATDTQIIMDPAVSAAFNADTDPFVPFDVVIGYGVKTKPGLTNVTISPSSPTTATIVLTGGTFTDGLDSHAVFNIINSAGNDHDRNTGAHRITGFPILPTNQAFLEYGGVRSSQPGAGGIGVTGVFVIQVDPGTAVGTGTLTKSTSGPDDILSWTAPGDAIGPSKVIAVDGHVRLFSSNGQYIDLLIDFSLVPGGAVAESIEIGGFTSIDINVDAPGSTFNFWTAGEVKTVTAVQDSGPNKAWILDSPLQSDYAFRDTVYLKNDTFPLIAEAKDSFGEMVVTVDTANEPAGNTGDAIVVSGSELPDGYLNQNANTKYLIHPFAKFNFGALRVF